MSIIFSIGARANFFVYFAWVFAFASQGFSQTENSIRIDSVSVIGSTGNVIIGWTLQTTQTQGFIEVKRQLPDLTYGNLPTINNLNTSFYIDNSVNAGNQPFSYFVAAFDGGGGTLAPSLAHQTIFLRQPQTDFCKGQVVLSWSNYQVTTTTLIQQRPVPFDGLRVQISTDGSSFHTIATLSLPPISPGIQEYNVSGLSPGLYFFRIRAFSSITGHTSTSNIRSFGYNPPAISDLAIDYVDVFENSEARISFSASGSTNAFYFELFRSLKPDQGYQLVGQTPVVSVFSDRPEIGQGPWYYKIKAWLKDWKCDLPGFESPKPFSSIFLSAGKPENLSEVKLAWEHFLPPARNFVYNLLVLPFNGQWQSISGFSATQPGTFIHKTTPGELVGHVLYKIEARDLSFPNPVISSNYVVAYIEPVVNIPNAFRPASNDQRNTVLKPDFRGFIPEHFQFWIFNRWGQTVFESSDPAHGWNGNLDTSLAEPGVYSFMLNYTAPGGKKFERRGVVTLVR